MTGVGLSGITPLLYSAGGTIYDKGRGVLATIIFISANAGIAVVPLLIRLALNINSLFSLSVSIIFIFIILFVILISSFSKKIKIFK